ncbi:MAG: hypothetical protein WCW52_00720 [Elusimicrobiales bacterium]|jgi:hypothetical protein
MAEEKTGTFSVIAADERLPDFILLTKLISESRGLNRDDAGRLARHSWGFLGEGLTGTQADELLKRCGLCGIKAVKTETGGPAALKPPLYIKKAAFEGGVFNYTDRTGRNGAGEKTDILVVAAAPVKEETTKTVTTTEGPSGQEKAIRFGIMAVTGLPIGMGKTKEVKKEVKSSELSFCMDLLLRTDGIRLRLGSNDFDFSCLKEKKTYSSQLNFRLLCAELAAFAPRALKNAGLLAIIENKPLTPLPYDAISDFNKEFLRLSLLK